MRPLDEAAWSAAALTARHEIAWEHPNKIAVHEIACPKGARMGGEIRVRRWPTTGPRTIRVPDPSHVSTIDGPFRYDDSPTAPPAPTDRAVWYPNFADYDLFGYWDGPLLAQDELQVAEHPILAAVRAAMLDEGPSTRTVDTDFNPTPITIEGAERRCAIDVMPHPDRPAGLYGNRFARASVDAVRAATVRIDPPTLTNIVAMAAPVGGRGAYTTAQIDWILTAAHTAFAATVAASGGRPVRLHAGFWGCGAFGGNRVLMALLQLVAAASAGIEDIVFHTFTSGDRDDLREARRQVAVLAERAGDDPSAWVVAVGGLGLVWGVSDGN